MYQIGLELVEPRFFALALSQIAQNPDELPPVGRMRLADRKLDREDRAVTVLAFHLAADPDDLLDARTDVVRHVTVVLFGSIPAA